MWYLSSIKKIKKTIKWIELFLVEEFPFFAALPAIVWQCFFSIVPVAIMLVYSFIEIKKTEIIPQFSTKTYLLLINNTYLKAISNSILLSIGTVLGCLLFCFPITYVLCFKIRRYRNVFLALMMLPSWTNFIIRIYSWFFLLDKRGLFPIFLKNLGIIPKHTQLLFNPFATIIGMVYCYFPFMLLPIYSAMEGISQELIEASTDLGATTRQTLRYVIIPICLPDILFGSLLVSLSAFGEFAIPELLGGSKHSFWAGVVAKQFTYLREFQSGAAYTFLGIAIFFIFLLLVYIAISVLKKISKIRVRIHYSYLTKKIESKK